MNEVTIISDRTVGELRIVTAHINRFGGSYEVGYIFYPQKYEDKVVDEADICFSAGNAPFGIKDSRPCIGCDNMHPNPLPLEVYLESWCLDPLNRIMGTSYTL